MFKSLRIKNILSHKDSYFEFDLGVNALIGESDCGKSAAFDAIGKVINNKPSGNELVSHWAKEGSIELTTTEGDEIVRIIGTRNLYILNGKELKAFGQGVPDQVVEALNMSSINMQIQGDRHFLLPPFYSPGEVARILNSLIGLDDIDKSTSYISKHLRQISSTRTGKQQELQLLEDQLQEYDDLDKMETMIKHAEMFQAQVSASNTRLQNANSIMQSVTKIYYEIKDQDDIIRHESRVLRIEKKLQNLNKLMLKDKALEYYKEKSDHLTTTINNSDLFIQYESIIEKLQSQVKSISEKEDRLFQLIRIQKSWLQLNTTVKEQSRIEKQLHKEFDKEFPDECPLCEAPKDWDIR